MELIENYIKKDEIDWHLSLRYSLVNEECLPEKLKNKINFICNKLNFFYGDDLYIKNPFKPMMVFVDGRRSFNVDDLNKEDVAEIKNLTNYTKDLILLGKMYDILWIIENEEEYGLKTYELYIKYFFKNKSKKDFYKLIFPLKRALFILCYLKKDDLLKSNIQKIIRSREFKEKDYKRLYMFYLADLLDKNRKSLLASFIQDFEKILLKDEGDDISLKFIEILINHYKSIRKFDALEKWRLKYVSVCKSLEKIDNLHGYEYLNKAINVLDPIKHENLINDLMMKRENSEKKTHDSFNMHEVVIDTTEMDKKINNAREQITIYLKNWPFNFLGGQGGNGVFTKLGGTLFTKLWGSPQKEMEKSVRNEPAFLTN